MGVDYTGNYGAGIQIILPEFEEGHEFYEDEFSWLDDLLEDTDYYYFEVGEEMYGGEKNEIYVCISEPFKKGFYDLDFKIDAFLAFLRENKIETVGEFDVVGGLLID